MRVVVVAVLAQHDDAAAVGELGEPLRAGDQLEHRGGAVHLVVARHPHGAEHRHLDAVHLADDHRHLRRGDELRQPLRDLLAQLGRREPGRLDVVDERQRDHAVGANRHDATQLGVLPHLDVEHVLGADAEGVARGSTMRAPSARAAPVAWRAGGCLSRPCARFLRRVRLRGVLSGAGAPMTGGTGTADAAASRQAVMNASGRTVIVILPSHGRLVGRQNRTPVTRRDGHAHAKHVPQDLCRRTNTARRRGRSGSGCCRPGSRAP